MKQLPKQYDPKEAEPRWQEAWEKNRIYAWEPNEPRENTFVIDTPPPTVSGLLHMGHIFSYTQADFVARYQRMTGKTVFYPMGFDDNGLPTERLVESIKGKKASQYPTREDFIKDCREVVNDAEDKYRALFKSTALSVDWTQEYQTVSATSRAVSQASFLDLLAKGQAYRDFRPTYWDWVDQTAIAQAEIENKELPGTMNEIVFTLEPSPSGRGLGEGTSYQWNTPKELVEKARELRKQSTDAEALLWSYLRDRQLQGYKFRRQHPVEQYVADFACVDAQLIIELDGGQHNTVEAQAKDAQRTEFLKTKGFEVIRFWNNDVINNPEGVLETISATLSKRPHPAPLPQAGAGEELIIATTRPELLGACVAVMYHPEDPNAASYKGKTAITPVFGVKVPMIADELVEREKGTGLVMCCTFGDDTDKEWWRNHKLPQRALLSIEGKLNFEGELFTATFSTQELDSLFRGNDKVAQLQGLKPKQANAKMLELLQAEGKLLKQTSITHTVKCAERSGTPIEIIPTYQWFVRITDKKEALKSKGAQCEWHPEFMRIRLDQWIDGLKEDWCVSRQRFFGVPFPIWYSRRAGEEGKVLFASADQLPVDPLVDLPKGYTRDEVDADRDVMDTWATSSVSPQLSAHGISADNSKDKARFEKLFPADLRPQAHEIIRTWAFYTIVKAHLHTNTIPWKHAMISGWCLAADKTKMSKSKGNVVTPVELIRDKGADVVRYWASTSRLGADTAFSEDLLKIGKKLVTKLWNATSFAAIHLPKISEKPSTAVSDLAGERITEMLDKWILTRLHKTIAKATAEFERLEYCDARVAIEEFFWKDFCDNYLELVKVRAYGEAGDATAQASAHVTLHHCLNAILRLFAPFLPHVTEELYTHLFDSGQSVHARGNWPKASDFPMDETAEATGEACVCVLEAVRKAKSERNVSIKFPITELVISAGSVAGANWALLEPAETDLKGAGTIASIRWADGAPVGTETADKRFAIAPTFGGQTDAA